MAITGKPRLAFAILIVSHALILLAGFFAPYNPAAQDRDMPFAPPTVIHFFDTHNNLHFLPFVYRSLANAQDAPGYHEDRRIAYPLHFFAAGSPYRLCGPLILRIHLFEADEPARIFLIGSDAFGRDQFSRFLYGGRISLFAGLLATAVSLSLAIVLGGFAGLYGGWPDELVMRLAEVFLALPWLYLLFAVRAVLPLQIAPNTIFLLLTVLIGALGWARPARLVRGVVLSAKHRDYVLVATGFGASSLYLLRRHILPQAWGVVLTQSAILIPRYVLAEVVLSLFGLGVSEPAPSWGNLLANLRQYEVLDSYWWMFLPVLPLLPIFASYRKIFSYYGYCYLDRVIPKGPGSSNWL